MTNENCLSEKAKKARNEYKRAWNRRNKDKVKAANNRYWEKKAREASGGDGYERKQTEAEIYDGGNSSVSVN